MQETAAGDGLGAATATARLGGRWLRAALLIGVAYYLGARLGFALTFQARPVSTLWAPNAILLAAFLLTPVRVWWMLLLGALPAHLLVEVGAGVPLPMVLCWFISNATEALLGAACIRWFAQRPVRFDRVGTVGLFLVFGAVLAPFLSSFLDAAFVRLNGWGVSAYWAVWSNRFFSNVLASLAVVPVIIAWGSGGGAWLRTASRICLIEAAALVVGLGVVTIAAFGRQQAGPDSLPALLYTPLPFLLWAAVRFGPTGASTGLLIVILLSTWNTVHGRGPFVSPSPESNALSLQLLFIVVAMTLVTFAAVIAERARAQDTAREKGRQLELAVAAARMGTWDLDIGARVDMGERARTRRSAVAAGSLDGVLAHVHPADRDSVSSAIERAIESAGDYEVEFRMIAPDGTVRWLMGRGKVHDDRPGGRMRLIGLHADVTERRRAEALTEGENAVLELIARGAPLAEILERLVTFVEAESAGSACSILLLEPDGMHVRHGAAPHLPEGYIRAIDGAAIGPRAGSCGTAMYLNSTVVARDIQEDPLWTDYRDLASRYGLRSCWSTPIVSRPSSVLGSFAIYHDHPRDPRPSERRVVEIATQLASIAIERQRAEVEADRQRTELAHLGRAVMLGQLSGTLAHELRQPLAAILSDAQAAQRMLAGTPDADPELVAILDDIVAANKRAADVLDRVRTMLVKGKSEEAVFRLGDVLRQTLRLVRADFAVRGVRVDVDAADDGALVRGSRVQVQQVLLNLIMNACEAMSRNAPAERTLTLSVRAVDETVELCVVDRGAGIPVHLLEHIFVPFVTSKPDGLGLGLSICRSIVRAHGGRLWAVNGADGGAAFHLRLPAAASDAPHRRPSVNAEPVGA